MITHRTGRSKEIMRTSSIMQEQNISDRMSEMGGSFPVRNIWRYDPPKNSNSNVIA